jgi:hypothetical protein
MVRALNEANSIWKASQSSYPFCSYVAGFRWAPFMIFTQLGSKCVFPHNRELLVGLQPS